METVLQVCLSNTIGALVVAVVATFAGHLGRRPALAHFLWVLVLIKLLTPPIFQISLGTAAHQTSRSSGGSSLVPESAGQPPQVAQYRSKATASFPVDQARSTVPYAEAARTVVRPWNLLRTIASHAPFTSYSLALGTWLAVAGGWWLWATGRVLEFRRLLHGPAWLPLMFKTARPKWPASSACGMRRAFGSCPHRSRRCSGL